MSNPNPNLSVETQFKPGWKSGKTKAVKIPIVLEDDIKAIARCLDRDQTIAAQRLDFAQSLVEQQQAPHIAINS